MDRGGRGSGDRFANDEPPPKLYDILTGTVSRICKFPIVAQLTQIGSMANLFITDASDGIYDLLK